jgi:hypothetical protein
MWRGRDQRSNPARTVSSSSMPKSHARTGYDTSTGQMFSEAQVAVKKRQHSDWIGELRTPSTATKAYPNKGVGARSLARMASIKLAYNFRSLTADHFDEIPWALAEVVWEEVVVRRRESFHTWKVLASAYPQEMANPINRYLVRVERPSLPLTSYYSGLNSNDVRWLTCLRISPKRVRAAELVALADIKNLAVLDLSDGFTCISNLQSSFDERVMRSWAEMAREGHKMQHLEVLMLGWQDVGLWIFAYLRHFPKLKKLIMTDTPELTQRNRKDWEPTALLNGWEARHAKRSAKSLRPIFDEKIFAYCAISRFMYHERLTAKPDGETHPAEERPPNLPVLEAWISGPREWHHILEDFPGTRTVWLDRTPRAPQPKQTVQPFEPRLPSNATDAASARSTTAKRPPSPSALRISKVRDRAGGLMSDEMFDLSSRSRDWRTKVDRRRARFPSGGS